MVLLQDKGVLLLYFLSFPSFSLKVNGVQSLDMVLRCYEFSLGFAPLKYLKRQIFMKDEVNFNVHIFKRVPKLKPLMMCSTFEHVHVRDAESCYFMQKVGCIV